MIEALYAATPAKPMLQQTIENLNDALIQSQRHQLSANASKLYHALERLTLRFKRLELKERREALKQFDPAKHRL